ncbi:MAG: nucleotide sugar dehydrogenase [Flavobacteriaceae bacterium]|jgi:UDP-N-acetyl-D-glucosamine/UDP-N-acetyl-D-galactosamine dehydrogenase|nr:nucleotide sugar dehydrogenase [Flavobacteriaceae bacterium]
MNDKIAILGLGYVGLPLATEFAKKFKVLGYDCDSKRVNELNLLVDKTKQVDSSKLKNALKNKLVLSSSEDMLKDFNVYISTVPTPVDSKKKPDLTYLISVSKTIGKYLKKGDLVIYESTVFPGCTEEECVPVLEKSSGLTFNKDFFCGYSPERINPGDQVNTLVSIKKVTSGSTPETANHVDAIYEEIIKAGTHKVSSIKVAEASKSIENAQRDLNISFINELAIIFDHIGIDTNEVIEAAATKWNFLKFKPGLVGGHCISVDPYFLIHKAKSLGYSPEVILAGRNVNDNMGKFIASKIINLMKNKSIIVKGSTAIILGITYKENCNDIRNSKVPDIYHALKRYGIEVDIYDPLADKNDVQKNYGINLKFKPNTYQSIILAVPHNIFLERGIRHLRHPEGSVVYDVKSALDLKEVDGRL